MRFLSTTLALAAVLSPLGATTLQRLTMDDLIQRSTAIVRVKVVSSRGAFRGQDIYTHYQLQVLETLKSGGAAPVEVAVPGGVANGLRQTVAGAPSLDSGKEYVIFLWTGHSGLTQVIGLSQGLFTVLQNAASNPVLVRPAVTDLMLDKSGHVTSDRAVSISLTDLRSQIKRAVPAGK
jgi:hypothetical protein